MERDISGIKDDIETLGSGVAAVQNRFAWKLAWLGIMMGLTLAAAQRFWK